MGQLKEIRTDESKLANAFVNRCPITPDSGRVRTTGVKDLNAEMHLYRFALLFETGCIPLQAKGLASASGSVSRRFTAAWAREWR